MNKEIHCSLTTGKLVRAGWRADNVLRMDACK